MQPKIRKPPVGNQVTEVVTRADSTVNPTSTIPHQVSVVIVRSVMTEEEKAQKKELIDNAKENYAEKLAKQAENASQLAKDALEIKFILNQATRENFDGVKKSLQAFAIKNEDTCRKLIDLMIEKSWVEPKFSGVYAQMSKELTKVKDFKFVI